jgi:hypothetical protein
LNPTLLFDTSFFIIPVYLIILKNKNETNLKDGYYLLAIMLFNAFSQHLAGTISLPFTGTIPTHQPGH